MSQQTSSQFCSYVTSFPEWNDRHQVRDHGRATKDGKLYNLFSAFVPSIGTRMLLRAHTEIAETLYSQGNLLDIHLTPSFANVTCADDCGVHDGIFHGKLRLQDSRPDPDQDWRVFEETVPSAWVALLENSLLPGSGEVLEDSNLEVLKAEFFLPEKSIRHMLEGGTEWHTYPKASVEWLFRVTPRSQVPAPYQSGRIITEAESYTSIYRDRPGRWYGQNDDGTIAVVYDDGPIISLRHAEL